jgi:hypothetical protein
MSDFLAAHPYLATNLVGVPVWLLLFALSRGRRATMLAAGMALVPFAPAALLHDGPYWRPGRLLDAAVGIEDALYLFLSGSFAWAAARMACRLPEFAGVNVHRALGRLASLTIAGTALFIAVTLLVGDAFAASLVAISGIVGILLAMRPARILPAAVAAGAYTTYHLANLSVGLWLWPQFSAVWTGEGWWASAVVSLPLGEILFSPLFAAGHVLALSWTLENHERPSASPR